MLRFIERPHLPQGKVKHIIIGQKYQKTLENALLAHDLNPIWLKNNEFVDTRLAGHCDLMAAHIGGRKVVVSEFLANSQIIHNDIELIKAPNPRGKSYPMDAGLNFCIIGDKLMHNPKAAYNEIVSQLDYKKICCKQGYTKCSICVVDENSILTADNKIARIAIENGIEALLVDSRLAELEGFNNGFIGGATFKIDRNKIAFTGVIDNLSERNKIERFLNERGIESIYLTKHKLFDIGSAIPITEEID